MIRIAQPRKILPRRQPELQRLNRWQRFRLGRYADRTRCRRCGQVRVDTVARHFGFGPAFTERALYGLGFAFNMGLACCCEESPGSSDSGSGSSEGLIECGVTCAGEGLNAPHWWDITISGLVDEQCDDCDTYNSTFRVEHNPSFSVNRCAWTLFIPEGCAICRPVFPEVDPKGANLIFLELFGDASPTVWIHVCHFNVGASGDDLLCNPSYWEINFREVFAEKPNCLELVDHLVDDSSPSQTRCPNFFTPPFGLVDACDANSVSGPAECRITAVTSP